MPFQHLPLLTTFAATLLYAVLRYCVFGDVDAGHIPLYVMNKALSWSSVMALLFTAMCHLGALKTSPGYWGGLTFRLALLHSAISVLLLSEAYYPRLFDGGKMNLAGESAMLFGVLTSCQLFRTWSAKRNNRQSLSLSNETGIAILCAIHVFILGFPNWTQADTWPGSMPPISLISFLTCLAATLACLVASRK